MLQALEVGGGPRQGGDVGCIPADPVGRVRLSYQARGGPPPQIDGGPPRNPFASLLFTFVCPASPTWHIMVLRCRCVAAREGRCHLIRFGACTPPHRQPLCGIVGHLLPLGRTGSRFSIFLASPRSAIAFHLIFFCRQTHVAGWRLFRPGSR